MESGIEDIAGLVRNLNIAVDAPQGRGQEPFRSTDSDAVSLRDILHMSIQSINAITSHIQSFTSLVEDGNSFGDLPLTEVCSLLKGTEKLTEITLNLQSIIKPLNKVIEDCVMKHIKSLGSQSAPVVFEILSHFDQKIKQIIRNVVLDDTSDDDVLWKVAEECYRQITNRSGNLDADDYFVPLEEALLGWPYDHDYEREACYRHEDLLDLDEGYAASFQKQIERKIKYNADKRQSWPDFWIRVLNNAPGGPTLFYPPLSSNVHFLDLNTVPTYLFRTFDKASRGRNEESVTASAASIVKSQVDSRTDILTLDMEKATNLLFKHLKGIVFSEEKPGNLVSWTSSLLFAIQYAFWRRRVGRRSSSDIYICAVDTRKFPKGQFVQDTALLNAYHGTAKQMGDPIENLFDFRLGYEDYYNGEYLSQGAVNHADRSCVFSLGKLIQAGLFELYPEFEEPGGDKEWANRVKDLRQKWSVERATTDREIQVALQVGRICFNRFAPCDIASLLLSFKNRSFTRRDPTGE